MKLEQRTQQELPEDIQRLSFLLEKLGPNATVQQGTHLCRTLSSRQDLKEVAKYNAANKFLSKYSGTPNTSLGNIWRETTSNYLEAKFQDRH